MSPGTSLVDGLSDRASLRGAAAAPGSRLAAAPPPRAANTRASESVRYATCVSVLVPPATICQRPSWRVDRGIGTCGASMRHALEVYLARQRTEKFSRASGPPMARAVSICATATAFTLALRPMYKISLSARIAGDVRG